MAILTAHSFTAWLNRVLGGRIMSRVTGRRLALAILTAHFLLGLFYSVCIPIWEAHDEWAHYGYIDYLIDHRALPKPGERSVPEGEFDQLSQPPLYYLLASLPAFFVNTNDSVEPIPNPYAYTGTGEGGVNMFLHSEEEAFPYQGTILAAHLSRLISVLIGTATVWLTYCLSRLLFPRQMEISLGAMAITAFSPQFLFIGSVITNDILAIFFSSLVLFFSVKMVMREPSPWDLSALGISMGLALLSKYNTLALASVALLSGGVAITRSLRTKRSYLVCLGVIGFLLGLFLVLGWWYSRGLTPGEALASRYSRNISIFLRDLKQPLRLITRPSWTLLGEALRYGFITFWASFGWGNVGIDGWIYQALALFCLAGLLGLVPLWRRSDRRMKIATLLLLFSIFTSFFLPAYRVLRMGGFLVRGRYVLICISAISVLLSSGLAHLVPSRFSKACLVLASLGLFLLGTLAPFLYIAPAYARPPLLTPQNLEGLQNLLETNFDNKIKLWGYDLNKERVEAGQAVRLTLYWQCLAEMEENYTIGIHLLDPAGKSYGERDTYPGRGNFATSLWKVGDIFQETYALPVSRRFPAPALARIKVALYLHESGRHLPVLDAQGNPFDEEVIFGKIKVARREPLEPQIEKPIYFEFGEIAALVGYDMEGPKVAGEPLKVRLYWRSLAETDKDYTVFLHLVDEEGNLWGQSDGQPRGGYYPTSLWEEGEVIEDEHYIPLSEGIPPGDYRLILGLYLLDTMERLPAFDQRGHRLLHDEITIEGVEIGP